MGRVIGILVGLLLATGPLVGVPSVADDYAPCPRFDGETYMPCAPDSDAHYWCIGNLHTDALKKAARSAILRMESTTIVNGIRKSSCTHADVKFMQADLDGKFTMGYSKCDVWAGKDHPRVCAKARVIIDRKGHQRVQRNPGGSSDGKVERGELRYNIRLTMCHELGHTLGLAHNDRRWYRDQPPDCMVNSWVEDSPSRKWHRGFNRHHRRHVRRWLRAHPIPALRDMLPELRV